MRSRELCSAEQENGHPDCDPWRERGERCPECRLAWLHEDVERSPNGAAIMRAGELIALAGAGLRVDVESLPCVEYDAVVTLIEERARLEREEIERARAEQQRRGFNERGTD